VAASVVLVRAPCGVVLVVVFEVEIAAKFGRLRLSQVWLGVYAAGRGLVEPAARKNVGRISAEGSIGCFSAASALKIKRFVEGVVGEEQFIALDDEIGRRVSVVSQFGELLLSQQANLLLFAII
jgi:hypothetical protein